MFPIKYFESNLVFNHRGECFAYYELIPYDCQLLSSEQKMQLTISFQQLIAQSYNEKIHILQIATKRQLDTSAETISDNLIDYRFFIGIKIKTFKPESGANSINNNIMVSISEFIYEIKQKLKGDFFSMDNEQITNCERIEHLLESELPRFFGLRKLSKNDFGYIIEHFYGRNDIPYKDYIYHMQVKRLKNKSLVKKYDIEKLTRCGITEKKNYLIIECEDSILYVAYFTINDIISEPELSGSEIFGYQQMKFDFSVDTSMNMELVTDKDVVAAVLEEESTNTKENVYKLSYVIRVSAQNIDELKRRCDIVNSFYKEFNISLVRPFGDMLGLHGEFIPASKRYMNNYVQYVTCDFLAGLGFGVTCVSDKENEVII